MGVIKAPVTALRFAGNFVLAGVGSFVKVYDKSSQTVVLNKKILEHNVIHGFKFLIAGEERTTAFEECIAAVYGGRELCMCKFNEDNTSVAIISHVKVVDWIWDAAFIFKQSSNVSANPDYIALALGHNSVTLFDWMKGSIVLESHCEEKCILYSAHFVSEERPTWDSLTLCSGTVFNQVVIWRPGSVEDVASTAKVIERIQAHDGVIFCMDFDHVSGFLVTASDDRSIRLWTCESIQCFCSKPLGMTQTRPSSGNLCKLYGHESRVWRVKCINYHDKRYLISIGEDGYCVIWELEKQSNGKSVIGKIMKKIRSHKGRNIWSLAIDLPDGCIATGGGDAGIRLFTLNDLIVNNAVTTVHPFGHLTLSDDRDIGVLKSIHMCNEKTILGHTDSGVLLKFHVEKSLWTILDSNENFKSYAIMRVCNEVNTIAIANTAGEVGVLHVDKTWNEVLSKFQFKAMSSAGKIHNMTWHIHGGTQNLFISGPEGEFSWYELTGVGKMLFSWVLPPAKHRWHMGAILVNWNGMNVAVCGDRRGSLHLFKQGMKDPLYTLHGIHGKNGVTSLQSLDGSLVSTGRDGIWRKIDVEFDHETIKVASQNRAAQGMDWLTSVILADKYTNNLVILGFHGRNFVAWSSLTSDSLMSIECGGGHRDWSFCVENQKSYLAFIKESTLNLATVQQDVTKQTSVLEPHFHGGQITSSKFIDSYFDAVSNKFVSFIATGSEDTKIIVSAILHQYNNEEESELRHVHLLDDHISNVRALTAIQVDSNAQGSSTMLFTGGGRATINSYLVKIEYSKCWKESCRIEHFSSHTLNVKGEKRKLKGFHSTNPEIRYMDLTAWRKEGIVLVAAACSDAIVRLFQLNFDDRSLQLIAESTSHTHCFLKISQFEWDKATYLVTGATDGALRIGLVDYTKSYPCDSKVRRLPPYIMNTHIHMSGINAMDVIQCSNLFSLDDQVVERKNSVVVTGGDDNSIQVVVLSFEHGACKISFSCAIRDAHYTQITGVKLSMMKQTKCIELISTSIDQRITKWKIYLKDDELKCQFVSSTLTNIADVSSLEVWKSNFQKYDEGYSEITTYAVCGQGIQIFDTEFG